MIPLIKSLALVGGAIGPTIAPIVQPNMANNQSEYETLMQPENFHYSAFDWDNEHGTRYGFSLGYLLCRTDKSFNLVFAPFGVSTNGVELDNHGLGFASDYQYDISIDNDPFGPILCVDEVVPPEGEDIYIAFYMVAELDPTYLWVFTGWYFAEDGIFETNVYWYDFTNHTWDDGQEFQDTTLDDSVYWLVYFDDGRNLPSGCSFDDNLNSWFVPKLNSADDSLLDIMAGFIDETIVSDKTGFLDSMEFIIGGQVVSMRKWLVWSIAIVGLLVLVVALFFFIRWIFRLTAGLFGGR